ARTGRPIPASRLRGDRALGCVMTATYELVPVDPAVADRLRKTFPDAPVLVADDHPGYPCPPPTDAHVMPPQLSSRQLSVRADRTPDGHQRSICADIASHTGPNR